ncbi:MAG: alpha/beta hydrolase [Fibrobacteres bacterium]|nr:alpha/beta hydrolase [Fibrobacterota bacterium]
MSGIFRDKASIEYTVSGKGDTTLLFVHGSYCDQSYWKRQVEDFQPDYQVVTLDLPGHGKSGKGREIWSVQGFAEDVSAVIRELRSDNIILIGHSLAGDINLIAATLHPESIIGFIGIDNFKNAATPLPEEYREQSEAILENLKTDFAGTNERYARMALLTPETPPEITDRVVEDFRNGYQPMGLGIMPEVFAMYRLEKELLPLLQTRLDLINVEYIPTNEEPLKRYAGSGYEVVRIAGTCHYPMLENPEALNAALGQVIRKITHSRAAFA